jgi:hypothetical protein
MEDGVDESSQRKTEETVSQKAKKSTCLTKSIPLEKRPVR